MLSVNVVSLADIFVGLSNRLGERPAIVSSHLTLSYEELVSRAARSARELRVRGVGPGRHVAIATRDSAETIGLMIAIWMLDAVAVLIDFRTRAHERASLAGEFDLAAILEDRQTTGNQDYASVLVDGSWTDVIADHDGRPLDGPRMPAPALISLTSGTSGRPTGVVYDHERLFARLVFGQETGIVRPGGRMLSALPLSYSASRTRVLMRLLDGATVHFHPPLFAAQEFAEAILSTQATYAFAVPTVIIGLLETYGARKTPLFAKLEALGCAGAPMSPEVKKQAKTALTEHFLEGYSSSVSGAISRLYGSDMDLRPDSVGRVLDFVNLQIVDDQDARLPAGEPGIVRVRSPAMASSIYGGGSGRGGDRITDGWVYPGDIGMVDEEGFLTLVGRVSDIIIRGGANVHPAEVEAALANCPGVQEVAVTGFAASREGEEIAAFVVADGDVGEAALTAHCRARLAPDKRPRKFVLVPELPRNANGKLDRAQLRERLERSD